jgi:TetR/AcrR family transcriptional regulator, repressor of fatR-cypB operon
MNEHSFIPTPTLTKDEAILDAALALFDERSYGDTPIPLVAERAGVAAGTIYRYFPGKQGLVNALYRHWKGELGRAVADPDPDALAGSPRAVFDGLWRRLCAFVVEHPVAFAFLETHHHQAYLDEQSVAVGRELGERMAALLSGWQADGAVRSGDPAVLVAQVYGGLVGVVRLRREQGRPLTDALAGETIDAAWALLAADKRRNR